MLTNWRRFKKQNANSVSLFAIAFVLNLLIFSNLQNVYSQMSCGSFDYECQVKEATKLIELDPQDYVHYYNRAVAYRNQGEYELAIDDYSKAIELKENFHEGYFNRAVLYFEQGKTDEAIEDILKAIEINPDAPNAYFFYGYIYFKSEKYNQALKHFNKAIELNPKYRKAIEYRAKTFNFLGENEKAQADLDSLKQIIDNA